MAAPGASPLEGVEGVEVDGGHGACPFRGGCAREAGCEWLHVDFDDNLRAFYFTACEFTPTNAGLIALQQDDRSR